MNLFDVDFVAEMVDAVRIRTERKDDGPGDRDVVEVMIRGSWIMLASADVDDDDLIDYYNVVCSCISGLRADKVFHSAGDFQHRKKPVSAV